MGQARTITLSVAVLFLATALAVQAEETSPQEPEDPCATPDPPQSCEGGDGKDKDVGDVVALIQARVANVRGCTLYSVHGGGFRLQVYPILGRIELDPDGCLQRLLPL